MAVRSINPRKNIQLNAGHRELRKILIADLAGTRRCLADHGVFAESNLPGFVDSVRSNQLSIDGLNQAPKRFIGQPLNTIRDRDNVGFGSKFDAGFDCLEQRSDFRVRKLKAT